MGNKVTAHRRKNKNASPPVPEVSIFCVTALCNVTLTALQKAHAISRLTSTYLKRKLFLSREVPEQLYLVQTQTKPKWCHTGKWNRSGQRDQCTHRSGLLAPIWTPLCNNTDFDEEYFSHGFTARIKKNDGSGPIFFFLKGGGLFCLLCIYVLLFFLLCVLLSHYPHCGVTIQCVEN